MSIFLTIPVKYCNASSNYCKIRFIYGPKFNHGWLIEQRYSYKYCYG
jgi:hypothetical protein